MSRLPLTLIASLSPSAGCDVPGARRRLSPEQRIQLFSSIAGARLVQLRQVAVRKCGKLQTPLCELIWRRLWVETRNVHGQDRPGNLLTAQLREAVRWGNLGVARKGRQLLPGVLDPGLGRVFQVSQRDRAEPLQEGIEVEPSQDVNLDVRLGADRRRTRDPPHEADLADVVTLVQRGDDPLVPLLVVDDDIDVAAPDDEQLVADTALAAKDLAGGTLGVQEQ